MQLILPATLPPGLSYRPQLMGPDDEVALLARLRSLSFSDVRMHGVTARRRTAQFGWGYAYASAALEPAPPLPEFLIRLRARAAQFARVPPESLEEALVSEYPPGAAIGWHRDAPAFGDVIVGVSLLSACRLRLRPHDSGRAQLTVELAPRSAYVISGAVRYGWQHHIPAVPSLRYSITFRTLHSQAPGG